MKSRLIKKLTLPALARLAILLVLSYLITLFYFSAIRQILELKLSYIDDFKIKELHSNDLERKLDEFKKFEDDLSFLKIPNSILKYNIYAKNNLVARDQQDNVYNTIMGIKIINTEDYVEISTGNSKRILDKSISAKNIYLYVPEYHFKTADENYTDKIVKQGEDNYYIFLKPNIVSFLIIFFISMTIVYGFFVILTKLINFVLYGDPFNEIKQRLK